MATLNQTLYEMFTESTGASLCDSGDIYGRNWERNQSLTLQDFINQKSVIYEDGDYTISTFKFLYHKLEIDHICNQFNNQFLPMNNWDSEIYGVSNDAEKWLNDRGFVVKESWNSYNGHSNLSQVIQGTPLQSEYSDYPDYILVQVHQGCDVRGGYTDARLFKIEEDNYLAEYVDGYIEFDNGEIVEICNTYTGTSLTDDCGNEINEIFDLDEYNNIGYKVHLYLMGE